jgi:hypothetical protein
MVILLDSFKIVLMWTGLRPGLLVASQEHARVENEQISVRDDLRSCVGAVSRHPHSPYCPQFESRISSLVGWDYLECRRWCHCSLTCLE